MYIRVKLCKYYMCLKMFLEKKQKNKNINIVFTFYRYCCLLKFFEEKKEKKRRKQDESL